MGGCEGPENFRKFRDANYNRRLDCPPGGGGCYPGIELDTSVKKTKKGTLSFFLARLLVGYLYNQVGPMKEISHKIISENRQTGESLGLLP